MHLEPHWVLLISVKSPSSLKKQKTDKSLLSVMGFFKVFFHANHLAVDATGGFRECRQYI